MFCDTNRRANPVPISNNKDHQKREINYNRNNFDPFASSPPNDFLRKLNNRLNLYDYCHELQETKLQTSRIKTLNLKNE